MIDHYKTLGLDVDATAEQVRKVFRELAKKYHPDLNAHRKQWANGQIKRLIDANRILSNARLREVYDRKRGLLYERQKAKLGAQHRPHIRRTLTQAEHILECLLSGRAKKAMADYERLTRSKDGFELSDHLELRDWVDAKFLIAEEYERLGQYTKALELYESLYHHDRARTRYSHFTHEVRDRILRLCCRKLAPSLEPTEAAQCFTRALSLDLTRAKKAFLHKKLAECHLAVGDTNAARRQLAIAFELKPNLKGATKICSRLGFDPKAA